VLLPGRKEGSLGGGGPAMVTSCGRDCEMAGIASRGCGGYPVGELDGGGVWQASQVVELVAETAVKLGGGYCGENRWRQVAQERGS